MNIANRAICWGRALGAGDPGLRQVRPQSPHPGFSGAHFTSIKYVIIATRVDDDGEGGILALMALLGVKRQRRPAIVALGLFGAALIYGDGAITPAISVLSALEGVTIAAPGLGPYVVPTAVAILIALFAIQSRGTARIGRAFGPVMAAWFATIALLGIWGITKHPAILFGLDPRYFWYR
jgi:KUP system potassium uptake protein